mgnify:CR=1 FL=1
MAVRVAINGFGRIGRLVFRAAMESKRKDLEFVAINDLGTPEANAHLLKYDSVHGTYPGKIESGLDHIKVDGKKVKVLAERDPAKLPWGKLDVDIVMECTGIFTSKEAASKHLEAGAKKVLVSAPATGADITVVYGVNHDQMKKSHSIVSNASCTTNCLVPVAWVLDQTVGIKHGFMTTVHSYTGDQPVVDTLHKDLRRARAAALSMIPTSTGAARATGLVLPELQGKLDGNSLRVPTPAGSVTDLVATLDREASVEEINAAIKAAAEGPMKGIVKYTEDPIVSSDIKMNPASCIFSSVDTMAGALVS